MINFIAFTGRAGSGKTTLAEWFIENYDYTKIAFADAVKYYAKEILMRPVNKLDSKDRKFLQQLGTDLARAADSEIWIKHFAQKVATVKFVAKGVVVDDCRFQNEAAWLRANGFVIVKVVGRGYNLAPELSNHPSESEVDNIEPDFCVNNSGSVEETICELLAKLVGAVQHE